MTKYPPLDKTSYCMKYMGKYVFYEMKKGEEIDPYQLVSGLNDVNPDAPVSEVWRIMKEYKEWKDEHETTA